MIRLDMKSYNAMLIEKQRKYLHYHQIKLKKNEYLTGEEILPFVQIQMIDETEFTYSPPGNII